MLWIGVVRIPQIQLGRGRLALRWCGEDEQIVRAGLIEEMGQVLRGVTVDIVSPLLRATLPCVSEGKREILADCLRNGKLPDQPPACAAEPSAFASSMSSVALTASLPLTGGRGMFWYSMSSVRWLTAAS